MKPKGTRLWRKHSTKEWPINLCYNFRCAETETIRSYIICYIVELIGRGEKKRGGGGAIILPVAFLEKYTIGPKAIQLGGIIAIIDLSLRMYSPSLLV